jgi:hypothetical protein
LSNATLDRVEAHAQTLKTNFDSTKEVIGQKVNVVKESYQNAISKTTYLSNKVQEEAFGKLHTLSLKNPEEYTVELIQYASQALDNGVKMISETVGKGNSLIKEAPKEIKDKIQTATSDALAAIHTAVEILSKQVISSQHYS